MKKFFLLPSRNFAVTIPVMIVIGFIGGLLVDTGELKKYILPVTILMIYPAMIGFKTGELLNRSSTRLLFTSLGVNFIFVPFLAYILGMNFLIHEPLLFAGLAITALLPTSSITIAFTMLAKGNVPAAVKITVVSLVTGSLLAPWYLLLMVGKYIPMDVLATLKTIVVVVFIPLVLGSATYSLLLKKYTQEQFNSNIKPYLPAVTAWGMVYMIFTSVSNNAHRIISGLDMLITAFFVQVAFYAINYLVAVFISRKFFNREDGISFVFSTVLRNLAISIGLAATTFGDTAALMVSLAFLIQGQSAAWFIRLNQKYHFLPNNRVSFFYVKKR